MTCSSEDNINSHITISHMLYCAVVKCFAFGSRWQFVWRQVIRWWPVQECDDRMLVSQRRGARLDKCEDKHTCCQPSKTNTKTHTKTNTKPEGVRGLTNAKANTLAAKLHRLIAAATWVNLVDDKYCCPYSFSPQNLKKFKAIFTCSWTV